MSRINWRLSHNFVVSQSTHHTECLGITECAHNDLAINSCESLKETEMSWDYMCMFIL